MVKKQETKKIQWKGETEEDRQESMFVFTTLNNIQARFGQQMTAIETGVMDKVKIEQIAREGETEEEKEG